MLPDEPLTADVPAAPDLEQAAEYAPSTRRVRDPGRCRRDTDEPSTPRYPLLDAKARARAQPRSIQGPRENPISIWRLMLSRKRVESESAVEPVEVEAVAEVPVEAVPEVGTEEEGGGELESGPPADLGEAALMFLAGAAAEKRSALEEVTLEVDRRAEELDQLRAVQQGLVSAIRRFSAAAVAADPDGARALGVDPEEQILRDATEPESSLWPLLDPVARGDQARAAYESMQPLERARHGMAVAAFCAELRSTGKPQGTSSSAIARRSAQAALAAHRGRRRGLPTIRDLYGNTN